MLSYLKNSIIDAYSQLMIVFGWTFILSFAIYHTSMGLRRIGSKWLGLKYYYLVSPGVVCHEVGHALGCLLTNKKIVEFVPFKPDSKGTLGYVNYNTTRTLAGMAGEFIVATGPIWFGCIVILLLTRALVGHTVFLTLKSSIAPGLSQSDYFLTMLDRAIELATRLISVWRWSYPLDLLLMYLIICIASEVTLSGPDIRGLWVGTIAIVTIFVFGNMIPVVDYWFMLGVELAQPILFVIHTALAFVLLVDFCIFSMVFAIDTILCLSTNYLGKKE